MKKFSFRRLLFSLVLMACGVSVEATTLSSPSVEVSIDNNMITLSWAEVPNAIGYQLVWNDEIPDTLTVTSVSKTNLPTGEYIYSIMALGDGDLYENSEVVKDTILLGFTRFTHMDYSGQGGPSDVGSLATATRGCVTITSTNATGSYTYMGVYGGVKESAGGTITISSNAGRITKIVGVPYLVAGIGKSLRWEANKGTIKEEGNSFTWTGKSSSITFTTITDCQWDKIEVYVDCENLSPLPILPTPHITASQNLATLSLSWDEIANAVGYAVRLNGGEPDTLTTTSIVKTEFWGEYTYSVAALGDGVSYDDSEEGWGTITVGLGGIFTSDDYAGQGGASGSGGEAIASKDCITLASIRAYVADGKVREYGSFSISSFGQALKKIEILVSSYSPGAGSPSSSSGTLALGQKGYIWEGDTSQVTFNFPYLNIANLGNPLSWYKIYVYADCSLVTLPMPSVSAVQGDSKVMLEWDEVPHASAYRLIWNNGEPEIVTSPFVKRGLVNGEVYTYQLIAVGDSISYDDSAAAQGSVVPTSSGSLLATPLVTATAGNGKATLEWDEVPHASAYRLIWNNGEPEMVTSPFVKRGLVNGEVYTYQLIAVGDSIFYDDSAAAQGSIVPNIYIPCGTTAFICALPNYGYHFTHWNDGNTESYRRVSVSNDEYVAYFEKNSYTLALSSSPTGGGIMTGATTALYLDELPISATANHGYHFVGWSDGVTDNPRTILLTQDSTIIAIFEKNSYNLSVQTSDATKGSVVESTTALYLETKSISAVPNYGYHFAQWNDGNTENPRSVIITKDTTFTAYFEKNSYTLALPSSPMEGGITTGAATALYLDELPISAEANCGYHFVGWSDGEIDNPRTILLTQDTTITAVFERNNYNLIVQTSDATRGSVEGGATALYLDTKTISATANYGYRFMQWRDGNTENPRTVEISRDTTFVAEFAPDGGRCGDNLAWEIDVVNKKLTFEGDAAMWNYTSSSLPWGKYKNDIRTLVLPKGVTKISDYAFSDCPNLTSTLDLGDVKSVGSYAFSGCANLSAIVGGEKLTQVEAQAFNGCQRMRGELFMPHIETIGTKAFYNCYFLTNILLGEVATDVGSEAFANCVSLTLFTCNAEIPPTAQSNSFTNVSCPLYVPCTSANIYRISDGWSAFSEISGASNYALRANSSNDAYGVVNVTAKPSCTNNAATVQAVAGTDCRFLRWEDAEHNLLSKMNPYSLTLNRDTTVYGIFTTDAGTIGGTSSSDQVTVETTTSTAAFTWPQVEGAAGYTLVIWSDAEQTTKLITLTFNAAGYLTNIDFAQHAPMRHTGEGLNFTVTGLDEAKHYGYSLYSQEDTRSVIDVKEGDFVTKSSSGLELIDADNVQFFLLKGTIVCDKEFRIYDVVGRDVTRYNGNLQGVYLVRIGNIVQKVVVK